MGHLFDQNAILLVHEIVFVVPEKGKVVISQPLKKAVCLSDIIVTDFGFAVVQLLQNLRRFGLHSGEVVYRDTHFLQHVLQLLLQASQFLLIAVTINFQHDQCFKLTLFRRFVAIVQLFELARAIAFNLQNGVVERMGANFFLIDSNANRVDQKRNIGMQNKHHGMGGLPTVTFKIGIKHRH